MEMGGPGSVRSAWIFLRTAFRCSAGPGSFAESFLRFPGLLPVQRISMLQAGVAEVLDGEPGASVADRGMPVSGDLEPSLG